MPSVRVEKGPVLSHPLAAATSLRDAAKFHSTIPRTLSSMAAMSSIVPLRMSSSSYPSPRTRVVAHVLAPAFTARRPVAEISVGASSVGGGGNEARSPADHHRQLRVKTSAMRKGRKSMCNSKSSHLQPQHRSCLHALACDRGSPTHFNGTIYPGCF